MNTMNIKFVLVLCILTIFLLSGCTISEKDLSKAEYFCESKGMRYAGNEELSNEIDELTINEMSDTFICEDINGEIRWFSIAMLKQRQDIPPESSSHYYK